MEEEELIRIEKVANKIKEIAESLHISRVPLKTKRKFINLAFAMFAGDYGMTLKYLLDNEDINNRIESLSVGLQQVQLELYDHIQSETPKEEIKGVKRLDGIERKKEGKNE